MHMGLRANQVISSSRQFVGRAANFTARRRNLDRISIIDPVERMRYKYLFDIFIGCHWLDRVDAINGRKRGQNGHKYIPVYRNNLRMLISNAHINEQRCHAPPRAATRRHLYNNCINKVSRRMHITNCHLLKWRLALISLSLISTEPIQRTSTDREWSTRKHSQQPCTDEITYCERDNQLGARFQYDFPWH